MEFEMRIARAFIAIAFAATAGAACLAYYTRVSAEDGQIRVATNEPGEPAQIADQNTVTLSETQLASLKVAPVGIRDFPADKQEIGTISFNDDMVVQVFTPYAGRIVTINGEIGQDVKKGDVLFTIDSPDLLQAESSLIAAAGVMKLTSRNLVRQQQLVSTHAAAEKDYEQAVSDQQTAEGALHTARDGLRVYGKNEADIDRIIEKRLANSILIVRSPISGRITARNASPGLFVQPGNAPAPYSVANINSMWMVANVAETDSPFFQIGQPVTVSVDAFPGHEFDGKIMMIDAMVDPNTRRVLVRSEVKNPNHELRSGMFANFVIRTRQPTPSLAVPLDGVVREPDGTMTVWVAEQRRRFRRHVVRTGMSRDGYWQILGGLAPGESVAVADALFLSNTASAAVQ